MDTLIYLPLNLPMVPFNQRCINTLWFKLCIFYIPHLKHFKENVESKFVFHRYEPISKQIL